MILTKRVLIASGPAGREKFANLLPGNCKIVVVDNLQHARHLLDAISFDLIAVGIYFDESQMFSLLSAIRNSARNADATIICFRPRHSAVGVDCDQVTQTAAYLMGAQDFIDLSELDFADDSVEEIRGRVAVRLTKVSTLKVS